jgi:hypothetical protein
LGLKLGVEDAEQWAEDCPDRVYKNWYAAYRCEPFGGETALLSRIASLLYIIASKGTELETVCKASDAIMRTLMPSDWVGSEGQSSMKKIDVNQIKANLQAMSSQMERAFG